MTAQICVQIFVVSGVVTPLLVALGQRGQTINSGCSALVVV